MYVLGKSLLITKLSEKYGLNTVTIEPALVFMEGGRKTATSIVESTLIEASIKGSMVVIFERCDELLPQDSEEEAMAYLIASWIDFGRVFIMASTTKPREQLHPLWKALFPLQFHIDGDFKFGDRLALLKFFVHSSAANSEDAVSIEDLETAARLSGGFLPCDLCLLAKQLMDTVPPQSACSEMKQGMTGRKLDLDSITWSDIYGQAEAKGKLISFSRLITDEGARIEYSRRGIEWPKGILLHGPPGTGKTKLARAMACSTNAHFMPISIGQVIHAEVGASETAIRETFEEARRQQPAIIFVDELDALVRGEAGSVPEKVMMQLVEEMDSIPNDLILILGATNLVDGIPDALRQPGRFSLQILVGPLTSEEQASMIMGELVEIGLSVDDPNLLEKFLKDLLPRTGAQVSQVLDQLKLAILSTTRDPSIISTDIIIDILNKFGFK